MRKSAQIQHLSDKQRKKNRENHNEITTKKEPDVTTYTKKYRVMEKSHLEGLFPFRETAGISFLLDYLKTY